MSPALYPGADQKIVHTRWRRRKYDFTLFGRLSKDVLTTRKGRKSDFLCHVKNKRKCQCCLHVCGANAGSQYLYSNFTCIVICSYIKCIGAELTNVWKKDIQNLKAGLVGQFLQGEDGYGLGEPQFTCWYGENSPQKRLAHKCYAPIPRKYKAEHEIIWLSNF